MTMSDFRNCSASASNIWYWGLTTSPQDRLWFWSDGSKFDHEIWAEGEPNNNNGAREPCIQMNFGGTVRPLSCNFFNKWMWPTFLFSCVHREVISFPCFLSSWKRLERCLMWKEVFLSVLDKNLFNPSHYQLKLRCQHPNCKCFML